MFLKKIVLKTVVCLVLIFVMLSVPAGAVTVSDFDSLKEVVGKGGSQVIYVNESFDMGYLYIPAGADITLMPEGKSVVLSYNSPPAENGNTKSECIYVCSGSNLTLSGDTGHNLTIKGLDGSTTLIVNIGKLTLESGAIISEHTSSAVHAGIKNKGLFVMDGGEIRSINGRTSGAVSVIEGGSFIMNDGIIKENTADTGAGIYLSEGSVSINGGSISQNNGHDIYVVGVNTLRSTISISGDAVISSIHFQNTLSENTVPVPVIQTASDFAGEVSNISYAEYVPKTKTAEFQSSDAAQSLKNKFSIANEDYSLIPAGNYLIVEPSPDFQFVLNNPTEVIIPKDSINIPVSLKVSNNGKVSSMNITSIISDESGKEVQDIFCTYDIKDNTQFSVVNIEKNTLTLSTGTDITSDIENLFTLIISNTESLLTGKTYTVTISIESSVSNTEDYTIYPTQTLTANVYLTPLLIAKTNNTNGVDLFGTPVWSFGQKAAITYIISPYETSLDEKWPAVSRNTSSSYSNREAELTDVTVYKSTTAYGSANEWHHASSTVSKNNDGTIKFNLADDDAKCFKIVFTGRKVGDVVEGTGDIDNVNLYDVDMILHAVVDKNKYIKSEWRLYADTDSDGKILLNDAMNAFNYFKGYTS